MKTKHTKGEWEFIAPAIVSTETKEEIALIKSMSTGTSRNAESLANAKLIAAAPELLRALNTISEAFWTDGETEEEKISDLQNIATEAIKKATE